MCLVTQRLTTVRCLRQKTSPINLTSLSNLTSIRDKCAELSGLTVINVQPLKLVVRLQLRSKSNSLKFV